MISVINEITGRNKLLVNATKKAFENRDNKALARISNIHTNIQKNFMRRFNKRYDALKAKK